MGNEWAPLCVMAAKRNLSSSSLCMDLSTDGAPSSSQQEIGNLHAQVTDCVVMVYGQMAHETDKLAEALGIEREVLLHTPPVDAEDFAMRLLMGEYATPGSALALQTASMDVATAVLCRISGVPPRPSSCAVGEGGSCPRAPKRYHFPPCQNCISMVNLL